MRRSSPASRSPPDALRWRPPGFLALTIVLSVNYNGERLYRAERGEDASAIPEANSRAAGFLAGSTCSSTRRRIGSSSVSSRTVCATPARAERVAYHDRATLSVLANLGMSTQLLVFGACIAFGRPAAFAWVALAELALVLLLALRRDLVIRLPGSWRGRRDQRRRAGSRPEEPKAGRSRRRTAARTRAYVGEILTALGMDLAAPGTCETPRRFLQALRDATAGYDGDPKLRTAFPASGRPTSTARTARSSRARLSSTRCASTTRFRSTVSRTSGTSPGRDHRDLEADAASPPLCAPLHRAGARGGADRGHARRARPAARRRRSARGDTPVHRKCAASRRTVTYCDNLLARPVRRATPNSARSSSPRR